MAWISIAAGITKVIERWHYLYIGSTQEEAKGHLEM
jgi:hypothetical protein